METKLSNRFVTADSIYKKECRSVILKAIMDKFPIGNPLNTLTLGGEGLKLEKLLDGFYDLQSISYEFNAVSVEKARQNAPEGVTIIHDNIFNHEYKGCEQVIWFDFTTALRYENVSQLLNWIQNNPITSECIFAVTYTLHSRIEGYRQLFDTDIEHDAFIEDMANYIAMYLDNEYVDVDNNISITKYCNMDINKRSLPMVQFIFKINRK